MRRSISLCLTLACVIALTGCNTTKENQVSTYSFRGENEYFTISNGSIVLSDTEEVFDGGDLEVTRSDVFDEVASYSSTFYTLRSGELRIILSNSVIDQTGSSINVNGDLGRVSGDGIIVSNKAENIDELKENLWFELKTTNLNGEENTYQVQLTLTE